jgi:hypothetical protein
MCSDDDVRSRCRTVTPLPRKVFPEGASGTIQLFLPSLWVKMTTKE